MFRHILVPVSFGESLESIEPFVAAMARRFQSKITLLHAIDVPVTWFGGMAGGYDMSFDVAELESAARTRLAAAFEATAAELEVSRVVQQGEPADCITAFAAEHGVELVMMPTHGVGLFRSLLLGSTTAKVLHDARCSVWTSAHLEDPVPNAQPACRTIVCAVNPGPEAVCVVRRAAEIARHFDATVSLVYGIGVVSTTELEMDAEYVESLLERARASIAKIQEEAGTSFDVSVAEGAVSSVIRDEALRVGADLIVTGHGEVHKTLGRLRSEAYAIIRDSPCPTLCL